MWWGVALVVAVLVLWPRHGMLAQGARRRRLAERTQVEDALKHLLDREYHGGSASFSSLAGTLRLSDRQVMRLLSRMQAQGLVRAQGRQFTLTPEGERLAMQVVRAHRLLERYLVDEARLPLRRVHREAERREHGLTVDEVNRLDASLGHPATDPHGDPIPTRDGYLAPSEGRPLTDWPMATTGRIVHLEDEPPVAYAQIVAEGLRVGQIVRLLERTPERLTFADGQHEYRLAPAVAANVFVEPVAEPLAASAGLTPLSDLPADARAEVVGFNDACQGFTRRRLLDLGFTPGAELEVDLTTFAGDPRAYRIRGTLIALRREQAEQILVKRAS
jgi:DtxR family Mn-dependent transcriptional regulator